MCPSHSSGPPRLRVAKGTESGPDARSEESVVKKGLQTRPQTAPLSGLVTENAARLKKQGAGLLSSFNETQARSAVEIPKGLTDSEALEVFNVLSAERNGRAIFPAQSLERLKAWASDNNRTSDHRRTYSVALFVDNTKMMNAKEARRALSRMPAEIGMQLVSTDPLEGALVLAAHIISHNGNLVANNYILRTASSAIELSYLDFSGQILVNPGNDKSRHDFLLTAATSTPAPVREGWWKALWGSLS